MGITVLLWNHLPFLARPNSSAPFSLQVAPQVLKVRTKLEISTGTYLTSLLPLKSSTWSWKRMVVGGVGWRRTWEWWQRPFTPIHSLWIIMVHCTCHETISRFWPDQTHQHLFRCKWHLRCWRLERNWRSAQDGTYLTSLLPLKSSKATSTSELLKHQHP